MRRSRKISHHANKFIAGVLKKRIVCEIFSRNHPPPPRIPPPPTHTHNLAENENFSRGFTPSPPNPNVDLCFQITWTSDFSRTPNGTFSWRTPTSDLHRSYYCEDMLNPSFGEPRSYYLHSASTFAAPPPVHFFHFHVVFSKKPCQIIGFRS